MSKEAHKMTNLKTRGNGKKKRRAVYTDLDHLAGTWSAEDAAEFERNTAAFETVDEAMWK